MTDTAAYEVLWWGTHPEEGNDDCWQGDDFETQAEALEHFNKDASQGTAYIQIVGPGIDQIRENPKFVLSKDDDDDDWKREIAMQNGMAFGCDGWNDAMGYGCDDPSDY